MRKAHLYRSRATVKDGLVNGELGIVIKADHCDTPHIYLSLDAAESLLPSLKTAVKAGRIMESNESAVRPATAAWRTQTHG